MKKLIILTSALVASLSVFSFQASMTAAQVEAEVAQRVEKGESIDAIVADASEAGISASVLQAVLVSMGKEPQAVFTAMLNAGFDPASLLPPAAAGGDVGGFAGSGFSGFGQSRASTIAGGGGRAVSPS